MPVICSAVDTTFSPAAGPFLAQVTGGGSAILWRRSDATAEWAVAERLPQNRSVDVPNPVAGAQYRFEAIGDVVVRAHQ